MLLSDIKIGQKVRIKSISDHQDSSLERIIELGVIPGSELSLHFTGPVGKDPLAFEVNGGLVAISKYECRFIEVEEV